MKLKLFIAPLLSVAISLSSTSYLLATGWSYDGPVSPEHWGELSDDFSACKIGKHQSPINITKTKKNIHDELSFHYDLTSEDIINNGHTVQINIDSDDDYLVYKNNTYYLKQFHFHAPSENQIKGKSYPLEVHFVHVDKNGKLLVLAVMAEKGEKNTELSKAWSLISNLKNKTTPFKDPININKFLPKKSSYYHFEGSLTTPPCTEGVTWILLKEPIKVSSEQITQFEKLFAGHHNNRPIQPVNDREVDDE